MRLNRTLRGILVLVFVGMLGGLGSALAGGGSGSSPSSPAPQMSMWLSHEDQLLKIDAWGGSPGGIGALVLSVAWGPIPGLVVVPITFDASGEAQVAVPIAGLNQGSDMLVGIQLAALAPDGTALFSPMWALQTRNYEVGNLLTPPCGQCPLAPGGWVDFVPWPTATGGPLYPHTTVAIYSDDPRNGVQPMLVLESGPAGSFPIN
jgi:hypothetical protein